MGSDMHLNLLERSLYLGATLIAPGRGRHDSHENHIVEFDFTVSMKTNTGDVCLEVMIFR